MASDMTYLPLDGVWTIRQLVPSFVLFGVTAGNAGDHGEVLTNADLDPSASIDLVLPPSKLLALIRDSGLRPGERQVAGPDRSSRLIRQVIPEIAANTFSGVEEFDPIR
jgi:hypothetical protein